MLLWYDLQAFVEIHNMDERLTAIDKALAINDMRKAEILIAKVLRNDNISSQLRASVQLRRANARLAAGRPDDALEEINHVLALRPELADQPEVKVLLGDVYFARFIYAEFGFADRANTNRALQLYNDVLNSSPNHPKRGWILYQRGRIRLSENNVADAIEDLHLSLEAPNVPPYLHAYTYERLGFIALFEERNPDKAITYLNQSIKHFPKGNSTAWVAQVHILRSRALRELKDYRKALKAASAALDILDPDAHDYRQTLTETHLAIGEVLALIPGREAEAISHLLQFLQNSKRPLGVDVTWSRVYETLGTLSIKLQRYEQAIDAFQASLQFNQYHPWEVNIHYQIARCYYRMRSYEQVIAAVGQMQAAAASENQSITDYRVYYVLANAYFALERYHEAARAYQHALDLAPPGADNLDKIQQYLSYSYDLAFH